MGGARTALFNWLYARKFGGAFLLRIEDTDRARSTEESTRAIFEGMRWLGLDWDDDVVHQGANFERHRNDAYTLLAAGAAYRCFCTAAELEERRRAAEATRAAFKYDRRCDRLLPEEVERRAAAGEPFTIRFRIPDGTTEWEDMVHERVAFPNRDLDDFVILRSDGTPIYNLAVVSDDIAMRVTLVMRGDDHISNTPKQILLYQALERPAPQFAHLPMIHGTDGRKLSKRHGATAVGDYQHMGLVPDAMVNFLALLGWSPGGDREVLTRAELIELFSPSGLQKKAAIFDPQKLEWMNGQHLSLMPVSALEPHATPAILAAGLATAESLDRDRDHYLALLELLRVRARTIDDIVRQARPYFPGELEYDAAAVAKHWKDRETAAGLLEEVSTVLPSAVDWSVEGLEPLLREFAERLGVPTGKLFQAMRVALTGLSVSPGIFEVLVIMGRDLAVQRITAAVTWLRAD